jgi:HAD superfamily hydrolase (TIGR01484 family)
MVTGREIPDLHSVCKVLDRFEWIVGENGALLYRPADGSARLLCVEASAELAKRLALAGVQPLSIGRAIIAIREPNETLAIQMVKELGLELQLIFNKGAVMILPTGVNKATGLTAVLAQLNIAAGNVVAVGDAENDHALLEMCGLGVAVSNAIPRLKEHADLVTNGARGEGVTELIERILSGDLDDVSRGGEQKIAPEAFK